MSYFSVTTSKHRPESKYWTFLQWAGERPTPLPPGPLQQLGVNGTLPRLKLITKLYKLYAPFWLLKLASLASLAALKCFPLMHKSPFVPIPLRVGLKPHILWSGSIENLSLFCCFAFNTQHCSFETWQTTISCLVPISVFPKKGAAAEASCRGIQRYAANPDLMDLSSCSVNKLMWVSRSHHASVKKRYWL